MGRSHIKAGLTLLRVLDIPEIMEEWILSVFLLIFEKQKVLRNVNSDQIRK